MHRFIEMPKHLYSFSVTLSVCLPDDERQRETTFSVGVCYTWIALQIRYHSVPFHFLLTAVVMLSAVCICVPMMISAFFVIFCANMSTTTTAKMLAMTTMQHHEINLRRTVSCSNRQMSKRNVREWLLKIDWRCLNNSTDPAQNFMRCYGTWCNWLCWCKLTSVEDPLISKYKKNHTTENHKRFNDALWYVMTWMMCT